MLEEIIVRYASHSDRGLLHVVLLEFHLLNIKIEKLMSTQAELAQEIGAVTEQVAKIGTETKATLQKVSELETALANSSNGVDPAVATAFAALKAQVQVVDDLIPDAPVAPAEPAAVVADPTA
jgi:hypothetical protein